MKNLKLPLVIVSILISSTGVFAQNFYISANAGYGFTINGDDGEYANITYTNIDNDITREYANESTYENVSFSLGKGFNFGGAFGYMLNKNIGFELGFSYLTGSKTIGVRDGDVLNTESNGDVYNKNNRDVNTAYSKMFRIIPSFVISPGFEKLNPYARFGVVLGFGSFIKQKEVTTISEGTYWNNVQTTSEKEKYEGNMAVGMNAVFGIEYVLNDNLSFFGEANYIGMRYTPQKSTLTESTYNGDDQLPKYSTNQKETEYYTSLTIKSDYSGPPDVDSPMKVYAKSYAFSSLGFNFGVKFNF